jgi:predicted PurR-regulated permease PerM
VHSFWQFFWLLVWAFFFVCYLMVLFQIVADVFRDRSLSGGLKAVWIVLLLIFPLITSVVYLIARGRGMGERQAVAVRDAKQATDAYIQSVAQSSPADQIATAKQLLDSGAISQAEFDTLKARALA